MAKRICKSPEAEDVAHYAIEQFMQHKRGQELVDKGQGMLFLSGIIHRSFHSSTSPYHKLYRQSGRTHELYDKTAEKIKDEEEKATKHIDASYYAVVDIRRWGRQVSQRIHCS